MNNFFPVPAFTWQEISFTWTDISFDWQNIDLPITWQQDEIDELLERMQNEIDGLSCPWLEFDFTEYTTLNDHT